MKQFIIEREPDANGMLSLSGKDFVYLIKVRRMREGDVLHALLPQSGAAEMVIDLINTVKKELRLRRQTAPLGASRTAPAAELILLQWVLKGSKTDTIIRQATEAGICAVLPVIGEFSVAKKQNPAQLERFRRIIKEARQQSGSPVDTAVTEPAPLAAVLNTLKALIPGAGTVFAMCSENSEASIGFHQLLAAKPSCIVLAIGAEGGISPAEAAVLRGAAFQTVHFKTNVLRAETAALYAIAAAQTIINEADQWQLPV
ncbi:RNA methyltransferase, RsmE family [Treponema vincentii ATCC 35580]|uniref:Ribosomal RNA small subunit methyltransferase E n=1 Tax=Treponema vincentii ATCC 35580 TaxID=596324 RepID=C8PQK3_9SPIR|nr:RsmE family RNA methyltransferase [Treponema vincentii]EEV20358.1 RNA methyltransferase, RsmE family [Treponema vincentii ATCC 35580]